jgi:hypothetical protein
MADELDFSNAVVGKYAGRVPRDFHFNTPSRGEPPVKWTNASVRLLADGGDPIEIVRSLARKLVLEAVDQGRLTVPVDPFKLAESQSIQVIARPDIRDAQLVSGPNGRAIIQYNPARPKARVRFSICHELGHTLFPDCLEQVRHRRFHTQHSSADHELEMLCNLAAAEMLLPLGTLEDDIRGQDLSIDMALDLRRRYEASTEAVLLRLMGLSEYPCGVFAATAENSNDLGKVRYRIEYLKTTQGWSTGAKRGDYLPANSIAGQCTVIGTTAKGVERWTPDRESVRVEVVGVPPYPGEQVLPRIVGLIMPAARVKNSARSTFELLHGDALQPRGAGAKIVAHIVNDATANWGSGFGRAVQQKWPEAQRGFKARFERARGKKLGLTAFSRVTEDLHTFQMVCQRGYGPSTTPRLRYEALRVCLTELRQLALQHNATVHMPKIGTGEAGGAWKLVSNLITEELCSEGVSVTVYVPTADTPPKKKKNPGLFD